MPIIRIAPDLEMHYLVDDFTDPWREAQTILLLHGNAESSAVWFGWVPQLGRHFPQEGVEWWIKLMARTPVSTEVGFLASAWKWDITSDFSRIPCPTLVITDAGSMRSSVEETHKWQQKIPRSTLLELPEKS